MDTIKYLFICETQYIGVNEMRMNFIVTIYLIKLFDGFLSLLPKKEFNKLCDTNVYNFKKNY